mgnify:CR=1 FL=1
MKKVIAIVILSLALAGVALAALGYVLGPPLHRWLGGDQAPHPGPRS